MKNRILILALFIVAGFMTSSCEHNNPNSGKFGATPTTCPNSDQFLGDYMGSTAIPELGETDFNDFEAKINKVRTVVDHCEYYSPNIWGNFVSAATGGNQSGFPYPVYLVIHEDNTVTVKSDADDPGMFPGGTGTYDPATQTFHLTLQEALFTAAFDVEVTITLSEDNNAQEGQAQNN